MQGPFRTLVFLFLVLVSVSAVVAADKIEGAFGLKFGEVFEPKTATLSKTPNDANFSLAGAYEFTPKRPNKEFTDYFVFITPSSHLVYKIIAVHKQPLENGQMAGCNEFKRALDALLHLKYEGTFDEKSRLDSAIGQGARNIGVTAPIGVNDGCLVAITYADDELAHRATDEREQNRVKATKESMKALDATGL